MQVPTTALMRSICRLWIHGNWKYGQMRSGPRSECKRYVFGVATGTCLVEVPAGHIQTSGRCSVIRAVSKDRCSDLLDNTWAGTLALPAAVGTQQQRCHGPARVRSKGGAALFAVGVVQRPVWTNPRSESPGKRHAGRLHACTLTDFADLARLDIWRAHGRGETDRGGGASKGAKWCKFRTS